MISSNFWLDSSELLICRYQFGLELLRRFGAIE